MLLLLRSCKRTSGAHFLPEEPGPLTSASPGRESRSQGWAPVARMSRHLLTTAPCSLLAPASTRVSGHRCANMAAVLPTGLGRSGGTGKEKRRERGLSTPAHPPLVLGEQRQMPGGPCRGGRRDRARRRLTATVCAPFWPGEQVAWHLRGVWGADARARLGSDGAPIFVLVWQENPQPGAHGWWGPVGRSAPEARWSPIIPVKALEGAAGSGSPMGGRAAAHRGPEPEVDRDGGDTTLLVRVQGSMSLFSRQGLSQSLSEKSSRSGIDPCQPELLILRATAVESAAFPSSGAGGESPRFFCLSRVGVSAIGAFSTPRATSRGPEALNPCPGGHDGVSLLSPRSQSCDPVESISTGPSSLESPEPAWVTPGTLLTTRISELRALPRKGARPGPARPRSRGKCPFPHSQMPGVEIPPTPALFPRLDTDSAPLTWAPFLMARTPERAKQRRDPRRQARGRRLLGGSSFFRTWLGLLGRAGGRAGEDRFGERLPPFSPPREQETVPLARTDNKKQ